MLGSLRELNWVERDDRSGRYGLGPGILSLARRALRIPGIVEKARPWMQRVAEALGETVFLGERQGNEVIVRAVTEGRGEMRIAASPGARLPLLAAATGKVILAAMTASEARRYLEEAEIPRFTEHSIADPELLWAEVEKTRARGFGTDDEEYLKGVRGVAVPIRANEGIVAILWTAGLISRMSPQSLWPTARQLLYAARRIGEGLDAATDERAIGLWALSDRRRGSAARKSSSSAP
jgi:DNA-binding IclR family transcriptional regulator